MQGLQTKKEMSKTAEYTAFCGSASGSIVPETIKRTIQPHEALVEITHAGLCGSDKVSLHKPVPLGHHGTGIVRDIGEHVDHVAPGDWVGFEGSQKPCGHCGFCIGSASVSAVEHTLQKTRLKQKQRQAKSNTATNETHSSE